VQIQQALAAQYKYNPGVTSGTSGNDIQAIQQAYHDYAMPVTPAQLQKDEQSVLAGTDTIATITSQIAASAKTFYANNPQLVSAIDNGQTVAKYASPYVQLMAGTLGDGSGGITAQTIQNSLQNGTGPYSFILHPYIDPTTGVSTGAAPTADQVSQYVRTNPSFGYQYTNNAKTEAASAVNGLATMFGENTP